MVNTQVSHTSSPYAAARLERALPRLEREWIPFNHSHLQRIISGFKAGAYDIDPERLIEELARDIGAITWLIHQAILEGAHGASPLEIVQSLTPKRAIELLEQRQQATHSLSSSTAEQLTALRSSSVAVGAAVGFAPVTDVSTSDAIGAELVLHVGRLLVAWNYPLAFARAVKADPARSIDERISDEIGFSPLMLSHLLATRWHIDPRFTRLTDSPLAGEEGKSLARLCEICEALASAEAPEFFPDARSRFEAASQAVRESLGPLGLKTLQDQITEVASPYFEVLGSQFCARGTIELGRELREGSEIPSNTQLALGSSRLEVRAMVKQLLAEIEPGAVDVAAAKRGMETLVQLAGFSAGCIYVFDPFTKVFRQRLSTGIWHRPLQVAMHEFAPGELSRQLAAAFTSDQVHVTNGDTLDIPSFLVVPLGSTTRIGVICFEGFLLSLEDSGMALSHAKAIRLVIERALKA